MSTPPRRIADPLTRESLDALRAQLAEGERLAWAASPVPQAFEPEGNGVGKLEAAAIIGGGYAAIGALVAAIITGHWFWFSVPIVLLIGGVLAFLATRSVKMRAQRVLGGTAFGVSTRRALLIQTFPTLTVQAHPIESIADVGIANERDGFCDLRLSSASNAAVLVFSGLTDGESNRTKIMRVIRDPKGSEEQMAAAEAYSKMMHNLARQSSVR